jgi:hypothetical protein
LPRMPEPMNPTRTESGIAGLGAAPYKL